MKYTRLFASVLAAIMLAITFGFTAPARAGGEGHIWLTNRTDAGIWVTAYAWAPFGKTKIVGAWCVPPGKMDKHGLSVDLVKAQFEFTKGGNCAHPLLARMWSEFGSNKLHAFIVEGKDGHYRFQQ